MGFFSSLGSFCSSVVSGIGSAVSSVGRGIASVASKAWDTAKSVAGKTIGWLADKAENFVGKVKDVWDIAKPWIEKITPWVDKAADYIPWPWLKIAVKTLAKGLEHLARLDRSPVLRKLEQGLKWAIDVSRVLRDKFLTTAEEREAEQRQKELEEAMALMNTEEQRQSVRFAALINDYILVQTRIQKVLDANEVKDFEHYLRLRATQKLLVAAERKLSKAEGIDEISDDDLFLMKIGSDLLAADPQLSDENTIRLDAIIKRRFSGKSLVPFVFEEMIRAWETKYQNLDAKWNKLNKEAAVMKRKISGLEVSMKVEPLTKEQEMELVDLKNDYAVISNNLNHQSEENRALKSYVHAAEGFLQVLEKTPSQFEQEDRDYILDDVATIGMLLIECAQNNKPWSHLTEDEQYLITNYANIFAEDSRQRNQQLIEVDV